MKHKVLFALSLVLTSALLMAQPPPAEAITIKVDYNGQFFEGPLAGDLYNGWFTFDTLGGDEGQDNRPAYFRTVNYIDLSLVALRTGQTNLEVYNQDGVIYGGAHGFYFLNFRFNSFEAGLPPPLLNTFLPFLTDHTGRGGASFQANADPYSTSWNGDWSPSFTQSVIDGGPYVSSTPEPGTLLLLSSGLVGLFWMRRKALPN